ncbi:MAG: hypothetical protein ACYCS7_07530 [Acidimicrobiales bacterium]
MSRVPRRIVRASIAALVLLAGLGVQSAQAQSPSTFSGQGVAPRHRPARISPQPEGALLDAGAAVGNFTPPPFGTAIDARTDPANCVTGTPLAAVYDGPRQFDFEEPYIDEQHLGHYALGDPFVDCNHNGRWDGNYIGGGQNDPRYYTYVLDPVEARALAIRNAEGHTVVVEVLDQEGLFNVYQARIRDEARRLLATEGKHVDNMFLSATHDEEAPDSLGLGGENSVLSGVNAYWVDYMVNVSAHAIVDAVDAMQPAHLRFANPIEPANLRQCWSSYPYVDDQLMPTLQAVSASSGDVIATLASVSQHAETLGFNGISPQDQAISADWPYWFDTQLQDTYGGVGIEMAGSVGSNETPQVFSAAVSRVPQHLQAPGHPAGCHTLFDAPAGDPTPEQLGYYHETKYLGIDLANAVISALDTSATWSQTDTVWGERASVCVPLKNALFLAAEMAGVFAQRPGYTPGCLAQLPVAPNGSSAGTSLMTQVAAFRIGDGEFVSVPGEVFPFTFLGSFLGPQDMAYPQYPMTPDLMAYMHAPYRFVDGLGEDMIGYIFPEGSAVGIPGQHPLHNSLGTTDTDRFGCNHSDDSESTGAKTGEIVGNALVSLLNENGGQPARPEDIALGRYVFPDGTLSRDPLGNPDSLKCSLDSVFTPSASGSAVAVWLAPPSGAAGQGKIVYPSAWMSLGGRAQAAPDRNTRGWIDTNGVRHWLDVFPDITTAPAKATLRGRLPQFPRRRT